MNIVRKAIFATTLAATDLVASTPAMAEHRDGRRNNTAAIAVGVGIVGIALGAIIASNKRDRYDDRYQVGDGWYYNDDYYYNRQGERYNRGDWDRGDWSRDGSDRGDWGQGDRRRGHGDRYYDRRGY